MSDSVIFASFLNLNAYEMVDSLIPVDSTGMVNNFDLFVFVFFSMLQKSFSSHWDKTECQRTHVTH